MPLQALKRQGGCERWRMPFLAALLLLVFTVVANAAEGP
jgi:ABC-type uncharacterized transport system permease subunit